MRIRTSSCLNADGKRNKNLKNILFVFRYDVRQEQRAVTLYRYVYVTISRVRPQQVDQVHGKIAQREHDHDRHQHLRRFPPGFYLSHRACATRGRRPVEPCNEIRVLE